MYCNGLLESPKKSYKLNSIQKTFFGSDAYAQIWSKVNF